jgi:NADH-quinone oxidoreductase subunit E
MTLLEQHGDKIDALIARYPAPRSAVLPLLYIAQDTYGPLTRDVIREVAEILDLSYTDVFEVVGFYTLFYDRPFGKWMIQVCDDVPCCYDGAEELIATLKERLNIREEETTEDGMFTLQRVKCLATCQRAPVVQANLSYFYEVTAERADALLRHLRERADSDEAQSVSGVHAEDYEPQPDGTFRQIERVLGPLNEAATASELVDEAQKKANGESASAPEAPRKEQAEQAAEAQSPAAPAPDKSPANAHPRPDASDTAGAVPPTAAQRTKPEPEEPESPEKDS